MIRIDIGKFFFVNRTIAEWNQLPEGTIWTSPAKTHTFRKSVRKVKVREVKYGDKSDVKLRELR
jgi:hypothetical protein